MLSHFVQHKCLVLFSILVLSYFSGVFVSLQLTSLASSLSTRQLLRIARRVAQYPGEDLFAIIHKACLARCVLYIPTYCVFLVVLCHGMTWVMLCHDMTWVVLCHDVNCFVFYHGMTWVTFCHDIMTWVMFCHGMTWVMFYHGMTWVMFCCGMTWVMFCCGMTWVVFCHDMTWVVFCHDMNCHMGSHTLSSEELSPVLEGGCCWQGAYHD